LFEKDIACPQLNPAGNASSHFPPVKAMPSFERILDRNIRVWPSCSARMLACCWLGFSLIAHRRRIIGLLRVFGYRAC